MQPSTLLHYWSLRVGGGGGTGMTVERGGGGHECCPNPHCWSGISGVHKEWEGESYLYPK